MEPYEVQFITTTETREPITIKNQYEFRADKKYHWLQRGLLWGLNKLKCYVQSEYVSFERHIIDPKSVAENLHKQRIGLLELYDMEGETLLIGPKEYQDLTGNLELRQMFHFTAQYNKGRTIMGMSIKVIPWMKGMLVVPNSALPKARGGS